MAILQGPALAFPFVLLSVPLGLAIDRFSRVSLLRLFVACSFLGNILTGLAHSFGTILVARGVVGLSALAINPLAISLIADIYAPSKRGRALMVMTVGQLGGMAASFALGGKLLSLHGAGLPDWQSAMLWISAPLIPAVLMMLAMRDPGSIRDVEHNVPVMATWRELWRHRMEAAPLLIGIMVTEMTVSAALVWTAPAFSRQFALAPDRIGVIVAFAIMVSGIVGPISGGMIVDLCQRSGGLRRALCVLLALTLLDAPAAQFPILGNSSFATFALVTFITVATATIVMGTAIFTTVIPERARGLSTALLAAGGTIAFGLAPVLVSEVTSISGGAVGISRSLASVVTATSILSAAAFAFAISHSLRLSRLGAIPDKRG